MITKTARDIEQERAVEAWRMNFGKGSIVAATGFGKSRVVTLIIERLVNKQGRTSILWLVPLEKLRDQEVPEQIDQWIPDIKSDLDLDVECYQSLGSDRIGNKYDLIVYDECHHVTPRVAHFIRKIQYRFVLGVTATLPTDRTKKLVFKELEIDKVVFRVGIKDAVDNGYVANYNVSVVNVEMRNSTKQEYQKANNKAMKLAVTMKNRNPNIVKAAYGARARVVYNSPEKVDAIIEEAERIECQTIIFAGSVMVAEHIANELSKAKAYHGGIKKKDRKEIVDSFGKKELRYIVAVKALDEGANIKGVDRILIGQCSSSERQVIQRVGRGIRKRDNHVCDVVLFSLVDTCDEKWIAKSLKAID